MLFIQDSQYYVSDHYLTLDQLAEKLQLSTLQKRVYQKIYGIERIPSLQMKKMSDCISQVVKSIMSENRIAANDVSYLIHCHTAKVIAPFGVSVIRDVINQLKLSNTVYWGTSLNNCASPIVMLKLLSSIGFLKNAIIVNCDYAFTPVLQHIPNTAILGDAVSAVLLNKEGQYNKLLSIAIKTAGQYAKGIWLTAEESTQFELDYTEHLTAVIKQALQKANIDLSQLKWIVPHNVNLPSWRRLATYLSVPLHKIYLKNVRRYSHCFGADIFINLTDIVSEGGLEPGDLYILATVGLGATFAAAVFQY